MKLKLADFGLAIDLGEERAVTRAGTLDYMVRPTGDAVTRKMSSSRIMPGCCSKCTATAWQMAQQPLLSAPSSFIPPSGT